MHRHAPCAVLEQHQISQYGVKSEAAHIQLSSTHAATVLAVVPGDQSAEMCSSASAALIMHSGTPLPGRVDAPTKYRPRTAPSLMDGRNTASWFRPCDRPKAAPCSTPYRCRHCVHDGGARLTGAYKADGTKTASGIMHHALTEDGGEQHPPAARHLRLCLTPQEVK